MLSSCTGVTEVALCFSSTLNCWCAIISRVQILLCIFQKEEIPNFKFLIMKRCPCNHYKAKTCLSFKRKKALWIVFMSYRISNLSKFCPQLGFSSLILSFSSNPFTLSALFFLSLSLFFHISWWNYEILNRLFGPYSCLPSAALCVSHCKAKRRLACHDTKALKHAHTHT